MVQLAPLRYPPATRGTVVVWGLLAARPFGGMTWQVLHHLAGFRMLGFDVWYVEDHDAPLLAPGNLWVAETPDENVRFVARQMEAIGLADRWILRLAISDGVVGHSEERLERLYREADAVFNLCAAHRLEEGRHDALERLVLLETDPVATQVHLANGDPPLEGQIRRYSHLFTYGQNLGAPDCPLPVGPYEWHPTRPPVVTEWWRDPAGASRDALTTVMNWSPAEDKDVRWNGDTYRWRKDLAFMRLAGLAERSPLPLELAVEKMPPDRADEMRTRGWRLVDASTLNDPAAYRDYVRASLGELSPTKEQYTKPRSGWFSDRSVCYLAAGRPVITEDTGYGRHVPTGEGLLAFSDADEAAEAIKRVAVAPERHARAAAAIAREHFEAELVLREVLETVGLL